MLLNPDCVRAILLAVEKVCTPETMFSSKTDLQQINGGFDTETVFYHARQCYLSGLITDFSADFSHLLSSLATL